MNNLFRWTVFLCLAVGGAATVASAISIRHDVPVASYNALASQSNYQATGYLGDGTVDAADYTVWRDTKNQTGTGLAADGNGDGSVNAVDYNLWVTNFGQGTAISTAVPEPGAWTLFLIAGLMLPSSRRRAVGVSRRCCYSGYQVARVLSTQGSHTPAADADGSPSNEWRSVN